jgi:hypothetical protein
MVGDTPFFIDVFIIWINNYTKMRFLAQRIIITFEQKAIPQGFSLTFCIVHRADREYLKFCSPISTAEAQLRWRIKLQVSNLRFGYLAI